MRDILDVHTHTIASGHAYHTLLEVNNNSLNPRCTRVNARENDLLMLRLCKQYGVPVIMGSDAHYHKDIRNHARSEQLLAEAGFPEELVVNTNKEKLYSYLN